MSSVKVGVPGGLILATLSAANPAVAHTLSASNPTPHYSIAAGNPAVAYSLGVAASDPSQTPTGLEVGQESIKFATGNLMAAGQTSVLKQSTTNLSNVLTGDDSFIYALVYMDFDRMHRNNYFPILGNSSSGSTAGRLQWRWCPTALNSSASSLRGRFQFLMRRASGTQYSFTSGVMPEVSGWYHLFIRRSTGGVFRADAYDMTGTLVADGALDALTQTLGGVDSFNQSHFYIGDAVDVASEPSTATARSINGNVLAGFEGSIAFVGIGDAAVSDADCAAIAAGEDPVTRIGAANFKYARRLADTGATSLAPVSGTSDTTPSATVIGAFLKGGTPGRQGAADFITLDPVPDYYGFGVDPDTLQATVPFAGNCGGVAFSGTITAALLPDFAYRREVRYRAGFIEGRFIGEDGTPVAAWQEIGSTTAAGITNGLTFTENSRSAPAIKVLLHGQSQMTIFGGDTTLNNTLAAPSFSLARYEQATNNSAAFAFQMLPEAGNLRVSDGMAEFAKTIQAQQSGAISIVLNALQGSSALDMIDDWSRVSGAITLNTQNLLSYAGGADVTVDLWQWFSTHQAEGANFGANILDAVYNNTGINATGNKVSDIRNASAKVVISPATRQTPTTAGPHDSDTSQTIGAIRPSMWAWAGANSAAIGPEITDMRLDTGEGAHQLPGSERGNKRIGIRMGEGVLRALGLSSSVDPTIGSPILNGAMTTITLTATLPNAGSSLRVDDTVTFGSDVQGFEISEDAGVTWSRSGFTGTISGSDVILTKASGDWTAIAAGNLMVRYATGSPFGYGTSLESSELFRGGLYDGTSIESGLGLPVRPMASTVVAQPAASAPTITSSSITGTPQDGQTLTANYTANGSPVPSASYQWQVAGVDIAGETASTYVIDAAGDGISVGDLISCEITVTNASGSDTAEPSVALTAPASLYDTGDMTQEWDEAHSDIVDADSFRVCRSGAGLGKLAIYSVPSGTYRITGTISAYSGAISGITATRFRIVDGSTTRFDTFSTGAIDQTVSITSGTLRFDASTAGYGVDFDAFFIEQIS